MAITPLQYETLALINAGKVTERNTSYGSWRIFGGSPTVVGRLGSLGMTVKIWVSDREYKFMLTGDGRAALSEKEQSNG